MTRSAYALAALVAIVPAVADAQTSFTAGALTGSYNCWQSFACNAREASEARDAAGAFVGMSRTLHSRMRVGAELSARAKDHGYKRTSITAVMAQALVRPTAFGFWLRGGLGIGRGYESAHQVDDMLLAKSSGAGGIATLGTLYELRVRDRVSLAAHATLGWLGDGDRRLWDVGLGLAWR